ncbi:hypothetical protein DWB77_04819 [Streptomyces hundungensis]|uniref:Uncharacterized protein n=1 Tax=Streptomyces hundungensis TaxID=1077946 RepID=A0A387HFM8_9ACTN|nr:hypothetical protein [Streptomyces hundungensis]AYG82636.1 hypothetical protein DWB77_04819 [Streptomyces hundungensis]
MTNNDMPSGDRAASGQEPAPRPAPRGDQATPGAETRGPAFPRPALAPYFSLGGSQVLAYAILSGRGPDDPNHLWAMVILCVAGSACEAWVRRRQ